MKRITFFFVLCLLISMELKAQTQDSTIAIPNSSFENWSNGNGYSVTIIAFPLQVYDSYTYPTGWDYPTYPVNQSLTYMGFNVNVNTNLPLLKISNMTTGTVNGSHALKMESFMLSDIISSTVYNLASSSLDPMMTNSVFPTILSTGVVDVMQFLPMMYDITSNFGNLSQLMSFLTNVNMSNLIHGGLPLNGVVPGRMTGYYKYTAATGGDNGGILMLGTRYNPVTHWREVVGAGYTVALTETSQYTPFELNYMPLCEIQPYTHYVEADSLVIFLFSSANTSPRQGSALYLDNLQLFVRDEPIHEDTCSAVFNLSVTDIDSTHATISWTYEGNPDHFELEYGPQGFTQGNGTLLNGNNSNRILSNLQPDSYYDVYVRCVCDNDFYGEWAMATFHTDTLIPPVIPEDTCSAIFNLTVNAVDTTHANFSWTYEGNPDHFQAEYGPQGFQHGQGILLSVSENLFNINDIQPDSWYDLYVRCVCDNELYGEWAMVSFHTDTLVPPAVIPDDTTGIRQSGTSSLLVYPNPAHGQCVIQFTREIPQTIRLYTLEGKLVQEIIPAKETLELTFPGKGVFIINCEMKEGTVVRKIVNQ